MPSFNLAQLNIAQLAAPLDSPALADFVANLDRINALADGAPGFVWRLQTETGDATTVKYFGENFVVNMSVWDTVQSLNDFVYRSGHIEIMRRRREWFEKPREAHMVLWWVPPDHIPSLEEGEERLRHLRMHGPTQRAFTFKQSFPAPNFKGAHGPIKVNGACPAA